MIQQEYWAFLYAPMANHKQLLWILLKESDTSFRWAINNRNIISSSSYE